MNAYTPTPTPWKVFTTTDGRKLIGIGDKDGQGILDCGFGVWAWNDAEGVANAELVVKAVNSHEVLVAALEQISKLDCGPVSAAAKIARFALTQVRPS